LLAYVKTVLAESGAQKVNLVAHSQGGLTSRYVADVAPGVVASVTTIATPHRGSEFADFVDEIAGKQPIAALKPIINLVMSMQSALARNAPDKPEDALAALNQLTTKSAAAYNVRHPSAGLGAPGSCKTGAAVETVDGNTHLLYSWNGDAFQQRSLFGYKTVVDTSLKTFDWAALTNETRLSMYLSSYYMFDRGAGPNDGMVSVCSSLYGQVIGTFKWNHIGETSLMIARLGGNTDDPVAVMRVHANRLKSLGA
jgi:triacylglycerol lipase